MAEISKRARLELEEEDDSREECVICKERVICLIFSCNSTCSILVCGLCQTKWQSSCPHCKSDHLIRNKAVEAIIGHKLTNCRYKEEGCNVAATLADMKEHLYLCRFGPIKCGFRGLIFYDDEDKNLEDKRQCSGYEYLPNELMKHWENSHGVSSSGDAKNGVFEAQFQINYPIDFDTDVYYTLKKWTSSGQVFFLHSNMTDRFMHLWVTGNETESEEFPYFKISIHSTGAEPTTKIYESVTRALPLRKHSHRSAVLDGNICIVSLKAMALYKLWENFSNRVKVQRIDLNS